MMISEGSGMHALSIAIIIATPTYPSDEMVAIMKADTIAKTFSVIASAMRRRQIAVQSVA